MTHPGADPVSGQPEGGGEEAILALVDNQDIGFKYAGSQTRYWVWTSERDRRRLTPIERATLKHLLTDGVVKFEHGYRFGRGVIARDLRWQA